MIDLTVMAAAAKNATRQMAHASTDAKNMALKAIANNLQSILEYLAVKTFTDGVWE